MKNHDLYLYVKKVEGELIPGYCKANAIVEYEKSYDGMKSVAEPIYSDLYIKDMTITKVVEDFAEKPILIDGVLSSIFYGKPGENIRVQVGESCDYLYGFNYRGRDYCGTRKQRNQMVLKLFGIDLEHPEAFSLEELYNQLYIVPSIVNINFWKIHEQVEELKQESQSQKRC